MPTAFSVDVNQYVERGLSWLLQHLGSLFASVAKVMVSIFIFLIALYYMFKDGRKLKMAVIAASPLQDTHDEIIFNKLALAINSVIRGNLAVALIQGILTAVGFALFGVPNPTLWGSVAAIAALVPSVGTALVLFPAILFLYWSGAALSRARTSSLGSDSGRAHRQLFGAETRRTRNAAPPVSYSSFHSGRHRPLRASRILARAARLEHAFSSFSRFIPLSTRNTKAA